MLLELHIPRMTQNKVLRPNTQYAMQRKKKLQEKAKKKVVKELNNPWLILV